MKKRSYILQLLQKHCIWLIMLIAFACTGNKTLSQRVEIHQLGLGDGDCSLIVVIDSVESIFGPKRTDTAVILIDAQRNSSKAATQITIYLDSILGKQLNRKKIDYVVVTHLHIDHYGNMVTVLKSLISKGYSVGTVFDRSAYVFPTLTTGLAQLDSCYGKIKGTPVLSKSAAAYIAYIKSISPLKLGARAIQPGDTMFIFKSFRNVSLRCFAANGANIDYATGKLNVFLPKSGSNYQPKSENDLSLVFLLSYQGFHYFTGGDIGGPGYSTSYADGETPISQSMVAKYGSNFHVCAFKVSHHGSSESTDAGFLTRMNPTLAVMPASLKTYGKSVNPLPTCITVDNILNNPGSRIAFTFVPNGDLKDKANYCKYKNLAYLQDVVIRVDKDPGYGSINMNMTYSQRSASTMVLNGVVNTEVLQCTKNHNW